MKIKVKILVLEGYSLFFINKYFTQYKLQKSDTQPVRSTPWGGGGSWSLEEGSSCVV